MFNNLCIIYKIIFCFFLLLNYSCNKKNKQTVNLNNNTIISLGHGGMGVRSNYPLNSYEGIARCLTLGANGTEFDVQLTKDSILVAYHDEKLELSTNLKGYVNSVNWNELKSGIYCKKENKNYKIARVDEIFERIGNTADVYFSFDCKLYPDANNRDFYVHQFANAILKIVDKNNLYTNCFVETQSAELMELLQKKSSKKLKLLYLTHNFTEGLNEAARLNVFGISISTNKISSSQVQEAHNNNLFIALWDVRTNRDNKTAITKNPDIIQSDEVKDLVKELR